MKHVYYLDKQRLEVRYITWKEWMVVLLIVMAVMATVLLIYFLKPSRSGAADVPEQEMLKSQNHDSSNPVDDFYKRRENVSLSKLGEVLFMNSKFEARNKLFKILVWKEGKFLERRHIKYFSQQKNDPFENCSVNNCNITYEDEDLKDADAVVFLLKRLNGTQSLPDPLEYPRLKEQRWIFLTDDSPWNVFANKEVNDWKTYSGIFNWSMNYKLESDIPVPYGRTLPASNEIKQDNITGLIPYFNTKQKDILVAMMTNDCPGDRVRTLYVKELEKFLKVDIYGECGEDLKNACSKHFSVDCKLLNNYYFYLAFENSNCEQYLTDNIYWNAYAKGAVPIVMGPTVRNCETLLPPNSYIHVDDFAGPEELAKYLLRLTDDDIFKFHAWRKNFVVVNEHGYRGSRSYHYCRICQALNYNSEAEKIYEDLSFYLDPEASCRNIAL